MTRADLIARCEAAAAELHALARKVPLDADLDALLEQANVRGRAAAYEAVASLLRNEGERP